MLDKMVETLSSFYISLNRLLSGKDKNTVISKTLERGRKYKNEGYLCSDSIFTKYTKITFTVEANETMRSTEML